MKCMQTSQPTKKLNILDWENRIVCPLEMIQNAPSEICKCRKQYFFDGSSCQLCPEYCNDCTLETAGIKCIEQDEHRLPLGGCDSLYFNEGYLCLKTSYLIPYQQNFYQIMPDVGTNPYNFFALHSNELNWNNDESFFLSFYANQIQQIGMNSEQVIATVKDGIVDIFVITISYSAVLDYYSINFFYKNSNKQSFAVTVDLMWIGMWTDFKNVLFFTGSQGQILYEKLIFADLLIFTDPNFCIGKCFLTNQITSLYLGQLPNGLNFVKGITNPYDRIDDLFFMQGDPVVCMVWFQASLTNLVTSLVYVRNKITSFLPTKLYSFSGASKTFIKKGLLLQNFIYLLDISSGKELSFSFNICFQSDIKEYKILTYTMDSYLIIYWLIFSDSSSRAFLRICINAFCEQTQSTYIIKNIFSFVAIILRNLFPASNDYLFYEYQIVTEFKREKIFFQLPKISSTFVKSSITFNYDSSNTVFINNMRFFTGSDFYFDYSSSNNCFLSYNISFLQCLKAKEGYSNWRGQVVKPEKCRDFSSLTQAVVFNQYTQECLQLTYIITGCIVYDEILQNCLECEDPYAQIENCRSCLSGFFKQRITNLCTKCSPKCNECSEYDLCINCVDPKLIPPNCKCLGLSQFMDSLFQCQNCSGQCEICQDSPDQCITCSEGRINPPSCQCDPSMYDTALSLYYQECKPITCLGRCIGCKNSADNCSACQNGRSNPPECTCQKNYFENGYVCEICELNQYYDSSLNQCFECSPKCQECSGTSQTCTKCQYSLILVNSVCLCQNLSSFILNDSGEIICYSGMETKLSILNDISKFSFVFNFEEELDDIDFEDILIINLLQIYLFSVPQETYTISSPSIERNTLKVNLIILKTISVSQGLVLFLNNEYFTCSKLKKQLDQKYLKTPLTFSIGPLLIEDGQYETSQVAKALLKELQDEKNIFLSIFKYLLFVFYILNTAQACIALLLIQITLPPNLYQGLQSISLLAFKQVTNFGDMPSTQDMKIFWIDQTLNQDYYQNNSELFSQRFSLSNCMILNIPIIIYQTILLSSLLFFLNLISNFQFEHKPLIKKIKIFILQKLNSHNEVSLLMLTTAIFNQFWNLDQEQYLNRISLYLSILIVTVLIIINYLNFTNLSISATEKRGGFTDSDPYLCLVEKLNFRKRPLFTRRYYFFQLSRKYILSILISCLQKYPRVLCGSCSALFLLSAIITAWKQPFKSILGNITKIVGEICLTAIWLIYLFKFIPFQDLLFSNKSIQREDLSNFLLCGRVVLIFLCAFNAIYLIEWIYNSVIQRIVNYISTRQLQQQQQQFLHQQLELLQSYQQRYQKRIIIQSLFQSEQQSLQKQYQSQYQYQQQLKQSQSIKG